MNEQQVLNDLVFMTVAGSHAYGTNTVESDLDRRGVCIVQDKRQYLGFPTKRFAQKDKWESGEDLVVYEFMKTVDLMLRGNPNMLELLFIAENNWEKIKQPWHILHENRNLFLSKRVRSTYAGYATSQLYRIRQHRGYLLNPPKKKPERSDFGLKDKKLSEDQQHILGWMIGRLLYDARLSYISEQTKKELAEVNFIDLLNQKADRFEHSADLVSKATGVREEFVDLFIREKRYQYATTAYTSYHRWKTERNPKRQELEIKHGYDTKHAMHLVRLLRMGIEIMSTGKVNVWRSDREELLHIRNGGWTFDQVENFSSQAESEFEHAYKRSSLPEAPAEQAIENLCINIIDGDVFHTLCS